MAFLRVAFLLLFQGQSWAVTFSPDAVVLSLPTDNDVRTEIDIGADSIPSSQKRAPVIFPIASNDRLCVLNHLLNGVYVPAGRSYEGNDWESPAGRNARLAYKCNSNQCEVNLPKEYTYYLTCYQRSLSKKDTVARFLEKTTFGATKSILDSWDYSQDDLRPTFAKFVRDEIQKTPTYHREYFRKRLNQRSIESYKYGMPGPRACETNSRWRKYAFTQLDAHLSSGGLQGDSGSGEARPNPRFKITIQTVTKNGQTAYVLSYAGAVRTVINEKFVNARDDSELDMTKSYYICDLTENLAGNRDVITDKFQIRRNTSGGCTTVKGGNPKVNLDSNFVDMASVSTLDMTALTIGTDLVEIGAPAEVLLLNKDISGLSAYKAKCETLPDPKDNDYRSSFLTYIKRTHPMWTNPSRFNPDPPVFGKLSNGEWVIHDYRLELKENTLENPLMDGGGQAVLDTTYAKDKIKIFPSGNNRGVIRGHESATLCANVMPSLFNREHCKISYEPNTCLAGYRGSDTEVYVTLDETFMSKIQGIAGIDSNIPVAIDGLVIDGSTPNPPCSAEGTRSRWLVVNLSDCNGASGVTAETITTFRTLLHDSVDNNPKLRDVVYREEQDRGIRCHDDDLLKVGFRVKVTEYGVDTCFENVHPNHLSIYDITQFMNAQSTAIKNEIKTKSSTGVLNWLSVTDFSMAQWHDNCPNCRKYYVGRLWDVMTAHDATEKLVQKVKNSRTKTNQALEVVTTDLDKNLSYVQLKGYSSKPRNGAVLVCGSHGEIAPDPMEDDYFSIINGRCDAYGWGSQEQKKNVWLSVVLDGSDQLRQRMAWALSQMLNVSPTTFGNGNEGNLYLYDLYVKNAFGNYKDLLREISFNPKMAEMLTFMKSSSVRFQYDISGEALWPDENYAREFMQLFTMGLHKLHPDGRPILDRYGAVIKTYDTKNILSFARVWTGFDRGARRGNYEDLDHTTHTYMGTMYVSMDRHDWFPKMSLDGGYIGDKEPLCWDLPPGAFLRRGAKYQLLGGYPTPRYHTNLYSNSISTKRVILDPSSALYNKLCNPNGSGECQFAPLVTLDENLACYGAESECALDTVVVVQVTPGVFYEYIQRPCVQLAYSQDYKKVTDRHGRAHMCAHPKMPVAISACCGSNSPLHSTRGTANCKYDGEKVRFDVSTKRCEKINGYSCDYGTLHTCAGCCVGSYNQHWPSNNVWYWTPESCPMKLKVRMDGVAAIVHDPVKTKRRYDHSHHPFPDPPQYVRSSKNMNYITVHWPRDIYTDDELFPTIDNDCWNDKCTPMDDWTCLCDIREENNMVFTSLPSKKDVLTKLRIGAFEPELYDVGDYVQVGSSSGVDVYKPKDSDDYTTETVFKVTDKFQKTRYFKNMESWTVIGTTDEFKMQTPSHFITFAEPTLRDIYYEIEATIDNIFENDSTPPFVSKLLIQKFGISNPSPRYVEAVSNAFFTGSYRWEHGGEVITYGDGIYGNLAATAAAIMLDREATSVLLDADPVSGSLREPLLKVMSLMKSMDYTRTEQDRNENPKFWSMRSKVGQMPYEAPDQFSFFRPDYMPPGGLMMAALTSPESEVLTMSQTIGLTSGFFSLIRNGLNDLSGGFGRGVFGGSSYYKNQWNGGSILKAGEYYKSVGYLNHSPGSSAEDSVNDIATLLTSGRLSQQSKDVLIEAYNTALAKYTGGKAQDYAWREILQLATTTPEFHANNLPRMTGDTRTATPFTDASDDPYKAIVVLYLFGGLDSYNLLIPHSSCGDLYDSYVQERGSVRLKPHQMNLVIDATSSEQPCDKFVVHHKAPNFKQIYDDGEGIFLANTGHLDRKVTKDNWRQETGTDLFSHTSLEKEHYVVDAFQEKDGTGILGRLLDVFEDNGFSVGPNGMNGDSLMLGGDPSRGRSTDVIPGTGIPTFTRQRYDSHRADIGDIKPTIMKLNSASEAQNSLYADYWSQNLVDTWYKSASLRGILNQNQVLTSFNGHGLEGTFKVIAQMIRGHTARKKNRDAFLIKSGGFDAHALALSNLDQKIPGIDTVFNKFRAELKQQGNYDKVTIIMTSEFGRTITPNSGGGTDHGWGGNYFMFGGGVKGGRILGEYPESFWDSDPTNIGRGRLIPTLSWDSLWHGIVQWYGVENEQDMKKVLPNHLSFGCFLLTDKDLYKDGTNIISGCDGVSFNFHVTTVINEPRYLTSLEQKKICEEILKITEMATGQTARCLIVGQQIIVNYARRLSDGRIDETAVPLKEYLNKGGSRILTEGDPTFSVAVDTSVSYTAVKNTNGETVEALSVAELAQNITSELAPKLQDTIQNMTALEEVVVQTDAPTISSQPSLQPTPRATSPPSQYPTTEKRLPALIWEIERIGVPLVNDENILVQYNMTDRIYHTDVLANDCKTAQDAISIESSVVAEMYYLYKIVNVTMSTNMSRLSESGLYTSTGDGGYFSFCVKNGLYLRDTGLEQDMVNFHEMVLNVTLDIHADIGFQLSVNLDTEEAEKIDKSLRYSDYIEAYHCDENRAKLSNPGPISQGGMFSVCVTSNDRGIIEVAQIVSLDVKQDGVTKFQAVVDGQATVAGLVETDEDSCVEGICKTTMIVIGRFFEDENPGNIQVVGSVEFGRGTSTGRYLKKSVRDGDMEEENKGSFELNLELDTAGDDKSLGFGNLGMSHFVFCGINFALVTAILCL